MEHIVALALQGVRMTPDPDLGGSYSFDPVARRLHLHPALTLAEVVDICRSLFPMDGRSRHG